MKIQFIKDNSEIIEGFTSILYNDHQLPNLDHIPNNSCEYILASHTLDDFFIEQHDDIIQQIISKLRANGSLVISGVDINVYAQKILNQSLSLIEASQLLSDKKSMSDIKTISQKLNAHGLKISTAKIMNSIYEIRCERVIK